MPLPSFLPVPDLMQARNVLAIQPHYDDNDIGAGGTLAALKDLGAEITYLTVTDDLMGVFDMTLSEAEARKRLAAEQLESGTIIGVKEQFNLDYPDAGRYDYFELRAHLVGHIRRLMPDFIFAPDPWLTYEAHRDHIQTGLAIAEAATLCGLPRIPSIPAGEIVDSHLDIQGVVFYYTESPNTWMDISATRTRKEGAVRCYRSQFRPEDTEMLLQVLDAKEQMAAEGKGYSHAEWFRVMHPAQLHCGL